MSTAMFDAIEAHDLERVAAELARGAEPNSRHSDVPSWRALHASIEELEHGGPIDVLVLLLRAGACADLPDDPDTPLLMAVFRGQPEAARLLLAAGADATVIGSEGDSPLRWCVEHGPRELVDLLLGCGAAATIDSTGAPSGMTALGHAARALDVQMMQLLLSHGADPAAPDADYRTPFERLPPRHAANAEHWDAAAALLGQLRASA